MTAQRPVAVAQLGCGYWGPNLLRNLAGHPDCRLAMVAEPAPARQAYVMETHPGVAVVNDPGQVFADPTIDAVAIATPAASHAGLTRAALAAGKHVLVEKPMAQSAHDAVDLLALARARGLVLMPGHTFVYNDAVIKLRALMQEGALGAPYYAILQRLNLGQLRRDVDVWWNLAPHDVSILIWLKDDVAPQSIHVTGTSVIQPGIADVAMATLRWADGFTAFIQLSWLDPGKVRRAVIVGDRRMVVYDDMADDKIILHDKGFDRLPMAGSRMDFDTVPGFLYRQRQGETEIPKFDFREPLRNELDHFVTCIRDRKTPRSGGDHAYAVVATLEAGARSLAQGGVRTPIESIGGY